MPAEHEHAAGSAVIIGAALAYAVYIKTIGVKDVDDSVNPEPLVENPLDTQDIEYSVAGLPNSGNTCFINATLHALASVKDIFIPYLTF